MPNPLKKKDVKPKAEKWKSAPLQNSFRTKSTRPKYYCLEYEEAHSLFTKNNPKTKDLILHLGLDANNNFHPMIGYGKKPKNDESELDGCCYKFKECLISRKTPIEFIKEKLNASKSIDEIKKVLSETIFQKNLVFAFDTDLEPSEVTTLEYRWEQILNRELEQAFKNKVKEKLCLKKLADSSVEKPCRVESFNFKKDAEKLENFFNKENTPNGPKLVLSLGIYKDIDSHNFEVNKRRKFREKTRSPFSPILLVLAPTSNIIAPPPKIENLFSNAKGKLPDGQEQGTIGELLSHTTYSLIQEAAYDLAHPCPPGCDRNPRY